VQGNKICGYKSKSKQNMGANFNSSWAFIWGFIFTHKDLVPKENKCPEISASE